MKDQDQFEGMVDTLDIYTRIYRSFFIHKHGRSMSLNEEKAERQLTELIIDIIDKLHTDCKGQIYNG